MGEVFANDVAGTVTSGGTTAPAAGTTETWTVSWLAAAAAASPATSPPTWFYVADTATGAVSEKILVTSCTGGTGSQSVTVTRGGGGTTPVSHSSGFTIQQVVTAGFLSSVMILPSGTPQAGQVPVATGSGEVSAWTDTASLSGAVDWINVKDARYNAAGDGITDDTAAIQAALNAATAAGRPVYLPAGPYKVSSQITVPPGAVIISDDQSAGATLTPAAAFSGNAVLYMPDVGGTSTAGPVLRHMAINGTNLNTGLPFTASTTGNLFTATGSSYAAGQIVTVSGGSLPGGFAAATTYYVVSPSGATFHLSATAGGTAITVTSAGSGTVYPTVDGYQPYGWIHGTHMDDVTIANMTGWGINSLFNSADSGLPNAYDVRHCVISSCGSGGIAIPFASDSDWLDIYLIGCGGDGWYIDSCDNSHFTACRSEWNSGNGFYITGAWYQGNEGSTSTFASCSTDRNTKNGMLIDATGHTPLTFSGCIFRRDGRNGGSGGGNYAGITCNATPLNLNFDGVVVTPGVDDNGGGTLSPQYAIAVTNCTTVAFNTGYLQGATGGLGGNGFNPYIGSGIVIATGPVSSPTVVSGLGSQFQLNLNATSSPLAVPAGGSQLYAPYADNQTVLTNGAGLAGIVPMTAVSGSVTLANSAAVTAIATASIPANDTTTFSGIDPVYRIICWGLASTTGTPTLTFTLAWGATTLITSAPVTLGSSVSNQQFRLEAEAHFPASNSCAALLKADISIAAAGWNTPVAYLDQAPATSVTVSSAENLAITAQWSAASAANTLKTFYTIQRVA